MTDNEIIKALECCWQEKECIGDKCPLFKSINDCAPLIAMEALDLINRQKAEKEALINGQETLQKYISEQKAEIERVRVEKDNLIKTYKECQVEAVKEFAERLKENRIDIDVSFGYGKEHYTEAVAVVEIDRLVKEFTEGKVDD
jgi:hypothetical protein